MGTSDAGFDSRVSDYVAWPGFGKVGRDPTLTGFDSPVSHYETDIFGVSEQPRVSPAVSKCANEAVSICFRSGMSTGTPNAGSFGSTPYGSAMRTRQPPPVVVDDSASKLEIRFYISDDASGNVPRLQLILSNGLTYDHPMSDYSSLTNTQKNNLRAMLVALRDETLTLEGYV